MWLAGVFLNFLMYWWRTDLSLANKSAVFRLHWLSQIAMHEKHLLCKYKNKKTEKVWLVGKVARRNDILQPNSLWLNMYVNNKELPIIYLYWFITSMFDFTGLFRFSFCSSSSTVIMLDTFSCFRPADTTHLHTKPQDMTLFLEQLVRWGSFSTSRKPRFLITVNYSCAPNTAAGWWCPCSLCAHKPVNVSQFVIHQKPPAMFSGHGIS